MVGSLSYLTLEHMQTRAGKAHLPSRSLAQPLLPGLAARSLVSGQAGKEQEV